MLASCGWRGIANVPLPGGPGSGPNKMTVYVQMPDTLALNVNSRVRVADVFVGSVRSIELKNWIATLTLDLDPDVKLPENATARDRPDQSCWAASTSNWPRRRRPVAAAAAQRRHHPAEELVGVPDHRTHTGQHRARCSHGGGIPNLEVIQTEVNNILDGHCRRRSGTSWDRLDTFTRQLNEQRDDLTRAIDSTNELLTIVAKRNDTLDRVLTEFPPLIEYFADSATSSPTRSTALGRFSKATDDDADAGAATTSNTNLRPCSARSSSWAGRRRIWSRR